MLKYLTWYGQDPELHMTDFIRKTLSYEHSGNEIIQDPDAGSSTTYKHVNTSTKILNSLN